MLGSDVETDGFEWWALIGPPARPLPGGIILTPHDRTRVLERAATVGPLHLRPGERLLTEHVRGEPWTMSSHAVVETHPIIVEGRWANVVTEADITLRGAISGAEGNIRERAAARALNRLCSLLSLAWGEPWQVRTSPQQVGGLPAQVPDSWPSPEPYDREATVDDLLEPNRTPVPPWFADVWGDLDDDEAARSGLLYWHQGLLMNQEFPSFALVAYTAAIEALAAAPTLATELANVAAEPCGTCAHVPHVTARFWATLKLEATPEEYRLLKKTWNVYDRRSTVAHGSGLLGAEAEYGPVFLLTYDRPADGSAWQSRFDPTNPAQPFVLRLIPLVRNLTSRLVLRALGVVQEATADEQSP